MDKRRKGTDLLVQQQARDAFYAAVSSGSLSVGQAVAGMRRLSRLTQPEFARHRGISLDNLRKLERDKGNPTVATLNKIADVFGLCVGFVAKQP